MSVLADILMMLALDDFEMKPLPKSIEEPVIPRGPEHVLLAHVLFAAIYDLFHGKDEVQSEVLEWLFREEYSQTHFSFRDICENLRLDLAKTRQRILNACPDKLIRRRM